MLTRILDNFWFAAASFFTVTKEDYSQDRLIEKMNTYLTQCNRRLLSKGYCHGLTLLWLQRMTQDREKEFYTTIKKIVDCPDENLQALAADIEKMRTSLDKKQNPNRHFFYCVHTISQENIDVILKTEKQKNLGGVFTRASLGNLLREQVVNDNMVCISSNYMDKQEDANHTVGLFKRDDDYYFYDSNGCSGRAECLINVYDVVDKLLYCIYGSFDMVEPTEFSLEIKLITDGRKNKKRFLAGMDCECLSKKARYT